jgi:hypothetical protein
MIYKFIFSLFVIFSFIGCTTSNEKLDSRCYEIPEAGKCRAMFTKFYFNQEENVCKSFIWGGCGGKVPFETLEECKSNCQK